LSKGERKYSRGSCFGCFAPLEATKLSIVAILQINLTFDGQVIVTIVVNSKTKSKICGDTVVNVFAFIFRRESLVIMNVSHLSYGVVPVAFIISRICHCRNRK
jgi:hypothetical protein